MIKVIFLIYIYIVVYNYVLNRYLVSQTEDEFSLMLKNSLQKYYTVPQAANTVTLAWDEFMAEVRDFS